VDVARPYADIIPGPRGRLLATLAQLETPVTARALGRHAGISPQRALDLVNDLSDAGVIVAERAGRALMVSLNRDHLATEPLVQLVALRGNLVDRLTAELSTWRELAGAWMFGSAARGDGGRHSDIDVLLVASDTIDDGDWMEATADFRQRVRRWTGNDVQLVEHTRQSLGRLVKRRNPLVAVLRAEGIPLTEGSRALLRGAA
jgi:predicted nucleotidyltransferase